MKATTFILGTVLTLFTAVSCNTTKVMSTEKESQKALKQTAFDNTGYTQGTIIHSTEKGDCAYTIALKDGRFFDPTNMENQYKKDGVSIWFKYRPLRMMNRCTKANPISIEEMRLVN